MIAEIKSAAEAVGVSAFITNSNEKIETQLNAITRAEQLPIMLLSWDFDVALNFNVHGSMDNPYVSVTCLLMGKASTREKALAEDKAEEMGVLYERFLQVLYTSLTPEVNAMKPAITNATYKLVPIHGAGKHSGIVGKFNMLSRINVKCDGSAR